MSPISGIVVKIAKEVMTVVGNCVVARNLRLPSKRWSLQRVVVKVALVVLAMVSLLAKGCWGGLVISVVLVLVLISGGSSGELLWSIASPYLLSLLQ